MSIGPEEPSLWIAVRESEPRRSNTRRTFARCWFSHPILFIEKLRRYHLPSGSQAESLPSTVRVRVSTLWSRTPPSCCSVSHGTQHAGRCLRCEWNRVGRSMGCKHGPVPTVRNRRVFRNASIRSVRSSVQNRRSV